MVEQGDGGEYRALLSRPSSVGSAFPLAGRGRQWGLCDTVRSSRSNSLKTETRSLRRLLLGFWNKGGRYRPAPSRRRSDVRCELNLGRTGPEAEAPGTWRWVSEGGAVDGASEAIAVAVAVAVVLGRSSARMCRAESVLCRFCTRRLLVLLLGCCLPRYDGLRNKSRHGATHTAVQSAETSVLANPGENREASGKEAPKGVFFLTKGGGGGSKGGGCPPASE